MGKSGKEKQKNKKHNQNWHHGNMSRELCYIALAVAVLTMCAWLSVPIGAIPFTLQTLGVCLTAGVLGTKRGTIAVGAYILLGTVGVPVFAGFTGGVAKLLSPTGGYIIGFLFAAPIIGWAADKFTNHRMGKGAWGLAIGMLVGLLVCYTFGVLWFAIESAPANVVAGIWSGFLLCVAPYFPFDFFKIAIAILMVYKLKKFIKL